MTLWWRCITRVPLPLHHRDPMNKKRRRSDTHKFYTPQSDHLRAEVKRLLIANGKTKQEARRACWQRLWLQWAENGYLATTSLLRRLVYLEHQWLAQPTTFLPDDADLLHRLQRTNYIAALAGGQLHWPYSVTAVAFPSEYRCDGATVQGCLFAYQSPQEIEQLAEQFYVQYGDGRPNRTTRVPSSHRELTFAYRNPLLGQRSMIVQRLTHEKWLAALQAPSVSAYRVLTGLADPVDQHTQTSMNEQQSAIQWSLLHTLSALVVYVSSGTHAIDETADRPPDWWPLGDNSHQVRVGDYRGNGKSLSGIPQCPHYRVLHHRRFYQGPWALWPPDSRRIAVNIDPKIVRYR